MRCSGRIVEKQETIQGESHVYEYTYDATGRLTAVAKDGTTISTYTYDANNNRIAAFVNNKNISATYDAQDRLLTYGTKTYTYTPDGEVASVYDSSNQTSWTYDYNVFGKLKNATSSSGQKITYLFDGEHKRVARAVNGAIVRKFVHNEKGKLIGLYAKGVLWEFVYASHSSAPDFMVGGGNKYYFVKDHLGSVRLVVDWSTGKVMQRLDYDEFGNVTQDTNPGFQPFGFAGGTHDEKTGLSHFGARDYDPSVGRWMERDPSLFGGGQMNLYVYVDNDPINLIDPSGEGLGHAIYSIAAGAGAYVGAAVAALATTAAVLSESESIVGAVTVPATVVIGTVDTVAAAQTGNSYISSGVNEAKQSFEQSFEQLKDDLNHLLNRLRELKEDPFGLKPGATCPL